MPYQMPGQQPNYSEMSQFKDMFKGLPGMSGGWQQSSPFLRPGGQMQQANTTGMTPTSVPQGLDPAALGKLSEQQGMETLLQILQSQGATDPTMMNQILSGISRDTATQQRFSQGQFAGAGAQNSGLASAISGALGQAGIDQQAQVRAQEIQRAEQRKRDDLGLLMELVLGPQLNREQMANNIAVANASRPPEPSDLEKYLGIAGTGTEILGGLNDVFGWFNK